MLAFLNPSSIALLLKSLTVTCTCTHSSATHPKHFVLVCGTPVTGLLQIHPMHTTSNHLPHNTLASICFFEVLQMYLSSHSTSKRHTHLYVRDVWMTRGSKSFSHVQSMSLINILIWYIPWSSTHCFILKTVLDTWATDWQQTVPNVQLMPCSKLCSRNWLHDFPYTMWIFGLSVMNNPTIGVFYQQLATVGNSLYLKNFSCRSERGGCAFPCIRWPHQQLCRYSQPSL